MKYMVWSRHKKIGLRNIIDAKGIPIAQWDQGQNYKST